MDRYIGIDAHLGSCTIAVMNHRGRRLNSHLVETNGEALRACIKQIPGNRHLCIEEGGFSEWLFELLEPLTERTVVVQPRRHQGSKSDSIDAWARADELRRGDVPQTVFKSPGTFSQLRSATRTYYAVREDLKRAKHRLKATFRLRAIPVSSDVYDCERRGVWMARLPDALRKQAVYYADEVDWLTEQRDTVLGWLKSELKNVPDAKYLLSVPGLAEVRTATLLSVVISPSRFRSKRQFWNYCGLAVVTRSSSDWVRDPRAGTWNKRRVTQTRGLNRNFHPRLKDAFKGAAYVVSHNCREDHPWRLSFQKHLDQGMKPNLAELSLARRIAATTLALWKRKELFDPTLVKLKTT